MAAVASPALRLRPRAASPSAPAFSASPRCSFSSSAYSYSNFARSFPIQRVDESRLKHLDTRKGQILRSSGNHDGWFHIKRIISFAATDKQEPITSPTSDTAVLEESESSSGDSPASGSSSYFTERGVGKPGFISFQGSCSQTRSVESVPHPGKEGSILVWFVGPTILVAKVLSAVFEDSLLTASATLAPYLVGLVVQLEFEQYARHRKSPSWPFIPIILGKYPKGHRRKSEGRHTWRS